MQTQIYTHNINILNHISCYNYAINKLDIINSSMTDETVHSSGK